MTVQSLNTRSQHLTEAICQHRVKKNDMFGPRPIQFAAEKNTPHTTKKEAQGIPSAFKKYY